MLLLLKSSICPTNAHLNCFKILKFTLKIAIKITQGNETLFPNWQKELWQTFEETSEYDRPERVNKWPNSMTDI